MQDPKKPSESPSPASTGSVPVVGLTIMRGSQCIVVVDVSKHYVWYSYKTSTGDNLGYQNCPRSEWKKRFRKTTSAEGTKVEAPNDQDQARADEPR